MRLLTARYQNQQAIIDSGAVPVQASNGRPKFPLRYPLPAQLAELWPRYWMLGLVDQPDRFRESYEAMLDQVGVPRLRRRFRQVSDAHDGRDLLLLCYEDLRVKPLCHRRVFAGWWERQTGEPVLELDETTPPPRTAPPAGWMQGGLF